MTQVDKAKPYNNLPLPPLKQEIETKKVQIKTISASRALGILDAMHLKEPKASFDYKNLAESFKINNYLPGMWT